MIEGLSANEVLEMNLLIQSTLLGVASDINNVKPLNYYFYFFGYFDNDRICTDVDSTSQWELIRSTDSKLGIQ